MNGKNCARTCCSPNGFLPVRQSRTPSGSCLRLHSGRRTPTPSSRLSRKRSPPNVRRMKNFISAQDTADIDSLVHQALAYKADPLKDKNLGADRRIGMLFLNPSMRTRLSTQIAAQNLGAEPIVFNVDKEGWALEFEEEAIMSGNKVEHVKDAAPIMGNYFDILCIRTFPSLKNKEDDYSELYINQFKKYSGIPVVSLESATLHPLQSLTDVITISEVLKEK